MNKKEMIIESYERYGRYVSRSLIVTAVVLIIGLVLSQILIAIGTLITYFAIFILLVSGVQLIVLKLVLFILKRK